MVTVIFYAITKRATAKAKRHCLLFEKDTRE